MKIQFIIFALLFLVTFIFLLKLPKKNLGFVRRCVSVCYNMSNKWVYKFRYLNGKVIGYFKAKGDEARLIYSSNIEKGTIDFQLFNSKGNLLVTFSANNSSETIKGIFVN